MFDFERRQLEFGGTESILFIEDGVYYGVIFYCKDADLLSIDSRTLYISYVCDDAEEDEAMDRAMSENGLREEPTLLTQTWESCTWEAFDPSTYLL